MQLAVFGPQADFQAMGDMACRLRLEPPLRQAQHLAAAVQRLADVAAEALHDGGGLFVFAQAINRADQQEGRHRRDRDRVRHPYIAFTILRGDKARRAGIVSQPLAQPVDQVIDIALAQLARQIAQALQQLLPRDELMRPLGQLQDQGALLPGQAQLGAVVPRGGAQIGLEDKIGIAHGRYGHIEGSARYETAGRALAWLDVVFRRFAEI